MAGRYAGRVDADGAAATHHRLRPTRKRMLQLFITSTTRFLGIALGALLRSPDGVSPISARRVLGLWRR